MPDVRELLERESQTVDLEHGDFERMLRRRERKQRNRRIGAGALGIVVMLLTAAIVLRSFASDPVPADKSPSPTPSFADMVITHPGDPYGAGDLLAQDPATGAVRTVVDSQTFPGETPVIYNAAVSGDGGWVAFDVASGCGKGGPGLWVTNGVDEPRELTKPCDESSDDALGLWGWSPSGAQLLVVLGSPGGEALVLIDPATGARTDLGQAAGDVTSVAWSPDGTRIAYGAVPAGSPNGNSRHGSVYMMNVDGGEHALIAESIGQVPGGEEGAGIQWSPDGTRIAVLADAGPGPPRGTLHVMTADGSGSLALAEGVLIEHVQGSPNIVWSPDGTRIAYATMSDKRDELQIWNGSSYGSDPILVFESTSLPEKGQGLNGGPVWSPDGTRVAFSYDRTNARKGWLVANADGTGEAREIDELKYLSWRGGWYFCECYG